MNHSDLRSKESQMLIVEAIKSAEKNTSGEIKVHIESYCKGDPVKRAITLFEKLKMGETAQKNGVLIYVADVSHKVSIIGDTGINSKVSPYFWDDILSQLMADFVASKYSEGICKAVISVGESLKTLFPYKNDDIKEKSDDVSIRQ